MVKLKEGLGHAEWLWFMHNSIQFRNACYVDANILWNMLKDGVSEDALKIGDDSTGYKEICYKEVKYALPIKWCLPIFEWE